MNKRTISRNFLGLSLLAIQACSGPNMQMNNGDAANDGPAVTTDAASDAPPVAAIQWDPCPLHSEGDGPNAECATIRTPLDRRNPNGPTIEMFVKRFRPEGGRGLQAMWMLQGGPGASGYAYEALSEALATKFPDVDYYIPDHRGTGRSTRLSCPMQESAASDGGIFITDAEWPACLAAVRAQYGDQLAQFNTTNAANDLGVIIPQTRRPGQPVMILGISYGTYWLHRFAQLFPRGVADGLIFDSIAPQGLSLFRQDEDANESARDFMAVCARDALCGAKLGPDPWAKMQSLFTRLKMGHCSAINVEGVQTHVFLRRVFGSLLMNPGLRTYIPAIVYRADRCGPQDIPALSVLMRMSTQPQPIDENLRQWGWILSQNIIHSEFNETPAPTAASLEMIRENAVASRDVTAQMQVNLGTWPVYTPDMYASQWADSEMPMLFLQGGLDAATLRRKAREARPHFTRPNQTWVEFDTAGHTTLASTPFVDEMGERRSCGTRLLMQFVANPTMPVNTGCVNQVLPLDFTLTNAEINRALFGTNNAWE